MTSLDAEYVLPLRWSDDETLDELVGYLRELSALIDVTVVDGSPEQLFTAHADVFPPGVRHLPVEPWPGHNGKVGGVMTGVRAARHDRVVVADDDVRYDPASLQAVVGMLDTADIVRPQNVFDPAPWHARWDTGRILLNRALGDDYPGTLAFRRAPLIAAGGYDGDVLFENLELIRTLRAMGGRERTAPDVFVVRRPPSARHFVNQRVRQAYDDFAQPVRLLAELLILPVTIILALQRPKALIVVVAAVVATAERGRRHAGGTRVFPRTAALWAPLWMLERGVCVWAALGMRLRGGVRYSDGRLRRAATPLAVLMLRHHRNNLKHRSAQVATGLTPRGERPTFGA